MVEVVIGLENYIAAAPSIAAAGSAFGNEGFAVKRDAALPTVAGARENSDFIDEHLTTYFPLKP